jgi:hypothetical protein
MALADGVKIISVYSNDTTFLLSGASSNIDHSGHLTGFTVGYGKELIYSFLSRVSRVGLNLQHISAIGKANSRFSCRLVVYGVFICHSHWKEYRERSRYRAWTN